MTPENLDELVARIAYGNDDDRIEARAQLAVEFENDQKKLNACVEALEPLAKCLDKRMAVRYVEHDMLVAAKAALEMVRGKNG